MKATAKDLRIRTKEILAAVERGEEVLITYRGKVKARMIAATGKPEVTEGNGRDLFGIWRDHEEVADVAAYIDGVRGGRFGRR